MSSVLAVYTNVRLEPLTTIRPAWPVQVVDKGFAYYREDQNTSWIKLDPNGILVTAGVPSVLAECASNCKDIKIALIGLKNKESVADAILRGRKFPIVEHARHLAIDQALSSKQILRLFPK